MENKWPKSVNDLVVALIGYLGSIEDKEIKAQTADLIRGLSVPIIRTGLKKKEMVRLYDLLLNVRFKQEVLETITELSTFKSTEQLADTMLEEYDKMKEQKLLDSDGMMPDDDKINPSHYQSMVKDLNIDAITCMRAAFGDEAVQDFCACNALKYLYRHRSKGGETDLKKCKWYLDKYLELNKDE